MDLNFLSYVLRSKRSRVQIAAGVFHKFTRNSNLCNGLFADKTPEFFDHESKYCGFD